MHTASSTSVRQIDVENLFSRYSYLIEAKRDSSLLILYGDNGSGKTTILRMLFHLLSTARDRGHLTSLGAVPFTRFEVTLDNGLQLFATRETPHPGPFTYGLKKDNSDPLTVDVLYDEKRGATVPRPLQRDLDTLLADIEQCLGRDIYYIGDDRSLTSDRLPPHEGPDESHYSSFVTYTAAAARHRRRTVRALLSDPRTEDLSNTLERASNWIRDTAIDATRIGTATTNQIYTDIIRRIAAQTSSAEESEHLTKALLTKLGDLEIRNNDYEPFGLSARLSGNVLRETIAGADPESRQLIIEILQPYLGSVEARLTAVSTLQSKLSRFVLWVNRFLKDKSVRVSVPTGIEIFTDDNQPLAPGQLSSGEQHLLLLLTSTLYAQQRPTLFVIDEPELSLNMKWQRQLPDALSECASGESTQFVLATHSFEILAHHQEEVVELIDQPMLSDHISNAGSG